MAMYLSILLTVAAINLLLGMIAAAYFGFDPFGLRRRCDFLNDPKLPTFRGNRSRPESGGTMPPPHSDESCGN